MGVELHTFEWLGKTVVAALLTLVALSFGWRSFQKPESERDEEDDQGPAP